VLQNSCLDIRLQLMCPADAPPATKWACNTCERENQLDVPKQQNTQQILHAANLMCLLSLNNSKAVKCKHLWLIITALRLQTVQHHLLGFAAGVSTQSSLAAVRNSSFCCRLCEPSCQAFLRKPLDFSSPYTNDDQQANDNHSPQQDSSTPFNKHLPLCD